MVSRPSFPALVLLSVPSTSRYLPGSCLFEYSSLIFVCIQLGGASYSPSIQWETTCNRKTSGRHVDSMHRRTGYEHDYRGPQLWDYVRRRPATIISLPLPVHSDQGSDPSSEATIILLPFPVHSEQGNDPSSEDEIYCPANQTCTSSINTRAFFPVVSVP